MTLLKAGIFVYYMHDMNADGEVKSGYVFLKISFLNLQNGW